MGIIRINSSRVGLSCFNRLDKYSLFPSFDQAAGKHSSYKKRTAAEHFQHDIGTDTDLETNEKPHTHEETEHATSASQSAGINTITPLYPDTMPTTLQSSSLRRGYRGGGETVSLQGWLQILDGKRYSCFFTHKEQSPPVQRTTHWPSCTHTRAHTLSSRTTHSSLPDETDPNPDSGQHYFRT